MIADFETYRAALARELVPAMGCTEPIALAYAAAVAGDRLGGYPDVIDVEVSRNLVKNVKSVVVPNTGGLNGIEAAVAAGFVVRAPQKSLEILSGVTDSERSEIRRRATEPMHIHQSDEPDVFFIRITASRADKTVSVTLRTCHTNITSIVEDGVEVFAKAHEKEKDTDEAWAMADVITAARTMPLTDVAPLLERQLACNLAISEEGLKGGWGASIGKILLMRAEKDPAVKPGPWRPQDQTPA